jgi:hypothetical protein
MTAAEAVDRLRASAIAALEAEVTQLKAANLELSAQLSANRVEVCGADF